MKKQTVFIIILMIISTSISAKTFKVGIVDMKKVFSEAPQANLMKKNLQESAQKPKDELNKLSTNIEKLGKKIEKSKGLSSPSEIQIMKAEYRKKSVRFNQMKAAINQGFREFEAKASVVILEAVKRASIKITKTENYDLILHEGFIHYKKSMDITDKVLKILRQDFKIQGTKKQKK